MSTLAIMVLLTMAAASGAMWAFSLDAEGRMSKILFCGSILLWTSVGGLVLIFGGVK